MLKFQYQAKSKKALNEETNQHVTEMATEGAVVKEDLDELETEKRVVSLVSRLKVLEVKMAILEPQYMINGKRHHVESTRWEAFKERSRRALLLTSGHGKLNFNFICSQISRNFKERCYCYGKSWNFSELYMKNSGTKLCFGYL